MQYIQVRIDKKLHTEIRKLAAETDSDITTCVCSAVKEYLENLKERRGKEIAERSEKTN